MLTNEDIQKIIEANKQLFYTKDEALTKTDFQELSRLIVRGFDNTVSKIEFDDLRQDIRSLITSIDTMTVKFQKYYEEQQAVKNRLDTIESWIRQAASKLGLDYKS